MVLLGETPIKTEVNVRKLFPKYPDHNHHYDIVVPSHKLIFECHGEQHFTIQTFGEKDLEKVVVSLTTQKHRDRKKEDVAWENDWGFVTVRYKELPKGEHEALILLKGKISVVWDYSAGLPCRVLLAFLHVLQWEE